MASSFALYDRLKESLEDPSPSGVLPPLDPQKMCWILNQLPPDHAEMVYAIILHHEWTENSGSSFRTYPYRAKTFEGGKGVKFTMTQLPPMLQKILAKYLSWIIE